MKISNIVIGVIFLVVISIFSLNFEELTGYVPKSGSIPELSVFPAVVNSGENIDIRVKVNKYCVDPNFEIVFENGLHKAYKLYMPSEDDCANQNFRTCKGSKYCKGDIKNDILKLVYKTEGDFKGSYKVRVSYIEKPGQDRSDEPFIEAKFNVA